MKKITKRILAGIMSAVTLASFAACSGGDTSGGGGNGGGGAAGGDQGAANAGNETTSATTEKTEWTGDNIEVSADEGSLDTSIDISGKTLKWMGFYDLNPTNDNPERSTEVALFEDTYGAKIEWVETTNDRRFDDLANAIIGGTSPDIFSYEWRAFPYDINKGQYQPIDSLIDWSDPMWADIKDTADLFTWKGEHYVAPFGYGFNDYQILMYDKDMVEEEGLDDPYELYEKGEWDWEAFTSMAKEFQGGDETRFGIAGWWANALVYTSGDTLVTYDGNKFTNNLYSAPIERAQAVIDDLWVNNLVKRGWVGPESAFTDGDTLFYAMGTWAYNGAAEAVPDHTVQVVPFPKDPNTDKYYMSKMILSHMWVKGSENADCVKAWYNVNRLVNYDPQYKDVTKQKFLANNAYWSDEIYDIVASYSDDDKFAFAFDYGYGLDDMMNSDYMSIFYEGRVNEQYESWITAREEFMMIVDSSIAAYQ